MESVLDGRLESHSGPEPRVLTASVQSILRQVIRPDDEDTGKSVALIAERAGVSTRTIYRILNPAPTLDGRPPTINLSLADRCVLAAGSHLTRTLLYWPDGTITPYGTL